MERDLAWFFDLSALCKEKTFWSLTQKGYEGRNSYLPAIGRFLIVVTFLEDALRIITQWNDQLVYLKDYRHSWSSHSSLLPSHARFVTVESSANLSSFSVPWGLTHLFLLVNVVAMLICSSLVIIRKYSDWAVFGLLGVVITQALGYGLIFDLNFFLRNLSVMGGLLMVLSDSWVRKRFAPAGLPSIDEKDRKMYIQLAGRVLLIFLFVGFVFAGDWGIARVVVSLFGFVACVMVVVGFKAKWSAVMLVVILSIFNLLVNNFWTVRFLRRFVWARALAQFVEYLWLADLKCWWTVTIAAWTPSTQRFCKIRLFPNSIYCVRCPFPFHLEHPRDPLVLDSSFCIGTSSEKYRITNNSHRHSVVAFSFSLTWVPAKSAWTRKRKSIDFMRPSILARLCIEISTTS